MSKKYIHSIKTWDEKDYGEHATECGTIIKNTESNQYSFDINEITCPICKKILIYRKIDRLNIELYDLEILLDKISKIGGDTDKLKKQIEEKNKIWDEMLNMI